MAIFVKVVESPCSEEWKYWYDNVYEMLSAKRADMNIPLSTLQGAYNLIIKFDASMIVSHFETVATAEVPYWTVLSTLSVPQAEIGQVIVSRDVDDGQDQSYFTNPSYTLFYARLGEPVELTKLRHVAIGKQVIVDITYDGMLAGVWMLDLPPEIGQKHAM